jgi:hypothetical protein
LMLEEICKFKIWAHWKIELSSFDIRNKI